MLCSLANHFTSTKAPFPLRSVNGYRRIICLSSSDYTYIKKSYKSAVQEMSDLRSNEHYLNISENKSWKKH